MLTASRTPLEELVGDFLVSGQARRLSPKTVDMVYRTRLERDFLPWCREQGIERVDQINQRVLDRYAAMLNTKTSSRTGKPLSAASVHSYMRTVNAFLSWCRKEGEQVSAKGSLPRLGQRVLDVLTPEQVNRMEAVATSRHERDGLIIRLLYETGIRVEELCNLRPDDLLEGSKPALKIRGKGNKERLVPISPTMQRRLRRYLRGRPEGERIFMSINRSSRTRDYEPLTPSGIDQMVRSYGKEAGITQRVYPHLFRHSYITHMMRKGVNIEVIRRIVGHSSAALISTVYGHLVSDDLWDAQARVWETEKRGIA